MYDHHDNSPCRGCPGQFYPDCHGCRHDAATQVEKAAAEPAVAVDPADCSETPNGSMGIFSRGFRLPSGEDLLGLLPGDGTYLGGDTTLQKDPASGLWRLHRLGHGYVGATPLLAWRQQPGHESDEWTSA